MNLFTLLIVLGINHLFFSSFLICNTLLLRGYEEISSQIDDWKPSNARTLLKDMPATAQATLDGPRAWESVWRDFMHRVYSEQLTKGQKLLAQDGRFFFLFLLSYWVF